MEGTILGALGDDLGAHEAIRWRMFGYEKDIAAYAELPNDSIFAFEHGRGYWLITKESHQLDTGPAEGVSTPTDSAFGLALAPGWNMIGNPFAFPVAWDSFMVDTLTMAEAETTVIEPPVGWLASKGYQYDARILEPFDGYWVKNLDTLAHVLKIPPREAPQTMTATPVLASSSDDRPISSDYWRVEIRASSEGASDHGNFVGVARGASTQWDTHDRSEPPMSPGDAMSLYFPHTAWETHPGSYAFDIRGEYEVLDEGTLPTARADGELWGHVWCFDLAKNFSDDTAGDEVSLEFSGIGSVPAEAEIILVDRNLERTADLREADGYAFFQGERDIVTREEDTRFVLIVGSEAFVESQEDELPKLPTQTALHQNFPNPFNPSTIIRYDIATAGEVDLRIFDVSGALVKILENRHRERGRYEIGWDGDNETAQSVSSGVYFYRLNTGGFVQTRKLLLLK
jgi:hypothetical protein